MSGGIPSSQRSTLRARAFDFSGILAPLASNQGVVFPYTPVFSISHNTNYGQYDITHSVYQPNYWVSTSNPTIDMTATFTAQDVTEAQYTAACLHFFKSCTKGSFGQQTRTSTSGSPPPVLLLSSYGVGQMSNVPVVLRNFTYTLPDDFDYVTFSTSAGEQTLPTQMLVQLSFTPQYAPTVVRKEFNINQYRSGQSGGFI